MKKVLTILAILVVLTSAIFAETHKIKVTAVVEGSAPVFALEYSETITTEEKTPVDGVLNGGTVNTEVKINKAKVSVDVLAKLLNSVKLANTTVYSLGFKAEPLTSATKHTTATVNDAKYIIKASETDSSVAREFEANGGIRMGSNPTLAYDNTTNELTGTITATMDTSNIAAADLATFHVEYPADPNAPVDTYEAYITLTITT